MSRRSRILVVALRAEGRTAARHLAPAGGYILDEDGAVQGRITLTSIVRGPSQSCTVGYWLGESATGRGLATRAVADIKRVAFGRLRLHRIEAGTLKHNRSSQRVLERNGFERFGLAPNYLRIDGRWQDHVLFQVVNES